MPPADPDAPEALVDAARRGDVAAFARIVRLHHAAMTRVALLVTGERRTAVQAVADAWPTAWRRPAGWLAAVAVAVALASSLPLVNDWWARLADTPVGASGTDGVVTCTGDEYGL